MQFHDFHQKLLAQTQLLLTNFYFDCLMNGGDHLMIKGPGSEIGGPGGGGFFVGGFFYLSIYVVTL